MHASSFGAAASVLLLLAGCVSVDPRASSEVVDREKTRAISGEFANAASYSSRGELVAVNNLATLFQVPSYDADRVRIVRDDAGLRLTWFQANREWETITFPSETLRLASDGSIELPAKDSRSAGGGGGYARRSDVRLFVNAAGDLATIQSSSAVGIIGILPAGVIAHHIAIFPRVR